MAYLSDVWPALKSETALLIQAIVPRSHPDQPFRERRVEAENQQRFEEVGGVNVARLFELGDPELVQTIAVGSSTVTQKWRLPLRLIYPTTAGWRWYVSDDVSAIRAALANTGTAVTGVEFREQAAEEVWTSDPGDADATQIVTVPLIVITAIVE